MRTLLVVLSLLFVVGQNQALFAQQSNVILEGYIYEDNNSGYLNEVKVSVLDAENSLLYGKATTNREGYFAIEVPSDRDFTIRATKAVFDPVESVATSKNLGENQDKVFIKLAMKRAPGYRLEVTLAEERTEDAEEVDAIQGSLIEVYNNTIDKEILVLKDHPSPYFSFQLEQGNHYTLLIRSPGYFTKRIESFVNVDGCILCMDGVSEIGPGVSDNLAYGNEMGTLLANIELKPMQIDSAIKLDNIYYSNNSAEIRPDAAFELDKVVEMLRVNPSIVVELSSHTDSRGKREYNQKLSQRRADEAMAYIVTNGIERRRLSARGYGESKLVNVCVDDVECDDVEHARNRRTELKITGFINDPFQGKPLAEIIAEENLDALLQEVLNQEQVKISDSGVAQPLVSERSKTDEANDELEKLKGDLAKTTETVNPFSPEAIASEATTPIEPIKPAETSSSEPRPTGPISVIVPETSITNTKPLKLPTGTKFSGYRVLVFQSPISLADDNGELFFKYGTLREDELAGGTFGYMSGAFNSEVEARSYLNNVKTLFPEARLLRYVNGFIIENAK